MTRVTAQQGSDKWKSRLSAASADMTTGVNNVTVAPGVQAAAKRDKWLAGVTGAADKWQRNVKAVSLSSWQQSMTTIGIPRVAQGAQAKQQKYTDFAASFYPFLDRGVSQVNQMPDTDMESRIQKAVAMMRYNATYQRPASGN
jgi:hypothetical protein